MNEYLRSPSRETVCSGMFCKITSKIVLVEVERRVKYTADDFATRRAGNEQAPNCSVGSFGPC